MNTIFKGVTYQTYGEPIAVGKVLDFKAINTKFEWEEFKPNKITVVSPFPAISTNVCDLQTVGISKLAKKYEGKVDFLTLSVDLPFTLGEWCGTRGVSNVNTLSDYNGHSFGKAAGYLVKDLNMLNRGAIIVDKDKKVLFRMANSNIHDQLDFDKVDQELAKLF